MWILLLFLVEISICNGYIWTDSVSEYRTYLSSMGKSETRLTDPDRARAFRDAMKVISEHRMVGYNVTMNMFADWLPLELESMFIGPEYRAEALQEQRSQVIHPDGRHEWVHDELATLSMMGKYSPASTYFQRNLHESRDSSHSAALQEQHQHHHRSLDWSTTDNPCRANVVAAVRDQGGCGACWAFSAISAIHASILQSANDTYGDDSRAAAGSGAGWTGEAARDRETYAGEGPICTALNVSLELSAQELIDCDSRHDCGCAGGNPVYAFQYIMRNGGLATEDEYPFQGQKHQCRSTELSSIATIKALVRLPAGRPDLIQQYLDLVGPVATGICGTDPGFLYYGGGVYDPDSLSTVEREDKVHEKELKGQQKGCCSEQNHAVLIVGYGFDHRSQQHYWKLQNSWGAAWGEMGYMRIVRRFVDADTSAELQEASATTQACGLDFCPSIPAGGELLPAYRSAREAERDRKNTSPGTTRVHKIVDKENTHSELFIWLQQHPRQRTALVTISIFLFLFCVTVCTYVLCNDPWMQDQCGWDDIEEEGASELEEAESIPFARRGIRSYGSEREAQAIS